MSQINDPNNNFCVIGEHVKPDINIDRTWLATKEAAEEHAAELLRRHYAQTNKGTTLCVVQRLSDHSIGMPPIVTTKRS